MIGDEIVFSKDRLDPRTTIEAERTYAINRPRKLVNREMNFNEVQSCQWNEPGFDFRECFRYRDLVGRGECFSETANFSRPGKLTLLLDSQSEPAWLV